MSNEEWVARLDHVSKEFRLEQERSNARGLIPGRWGEVHGPAMFRALDDVSLTVKAGEALGIVGRNGAGKSTVLKLLAGIIEPTSGKVRTRGRLGSVIELGIGFDPELTGRENINFAAEMQGMSRKEIRRSTDWIIEFSGIEEFLDMPVKRYSTGMAARLGFSVATAVPPDLLIVDEVLSVGDFEFQRKSLERIRSLHAAGTALVMVSHNLFMLGTLCSRAVLLERGGVDLEGPSRDVIARYTHPGSKSAGASVVDEARAPEPLGGATGPPPETEGSVVLDEGEGASADAGVGSGSTPPDPRGFAEIALDFFEYSVPSPLAGHVSIDTLDVMPQTIAPNEPIAVRATVRVVEPTSGVVVMSLFTSDQAVYAEREPGPSAFLATVGTWQVDATIPYVPLSSGRFLFRLAVLPEDDRHFAQDFPAAYAVAEVEFLVDGDLTMRPGLKLPVDWRVHSPDASVARSRSCDEVAGPDG